MDEAVNRRVGAAIRFQRVKKLRLTQEQLAEIVGISRPSVANIENGRQQLTVAQLVRFADALNVAPSELLPIPQSVGPERPPSESLENAKPTVRDWADRLLMNV